MDHKPTVLSLEADSMRDDFAWTEMLSTPALCPYSSKVGFSVLSSPYFHTRIVLSLPAETSLLPDRHLSVLIEAVCPFAPDVASRVPCVVSQALISPSYEPDIIAPSLEGTMSTAATQSSCSKDVTYVGGSRARTTSTGRVVSAEMPCAVRKSSTVVRRNWPLIRNCKGTRCCSEPRRLLTSSESPARLTANLLIELSELLCAKIERTCGYEDWCKLWEVEGRVSRAELYAHLTAGLGFGSFLHCYCYKDVASRMTCSMFQPRSRNFFLGPSKILSAD